MEAGVPAHNGRYVLPTFVEHGRHGVYEMDPYSKLLSERVIFLGTTVDDTSANDIVAQLLCLESDDPERDISFYLNSPGGSITAMMAIYDTMQFVAPDIETVCLGQTGSAAAILLAGGTPGKRMMLAHARVVIHQPTMDPGYGQTSDLHIQATEIMRVRATMENLLARHTGRSREQVRADIDRQTVLTGPEAIAYGIVDQVLGSRQQTSPADPPTSHRETRQPQLAELAASRR
jgi:ATP-dependent Clp protease protease subunit